jgi:hypothetical protein
MFCPSCGAEYAIGLNYCNRCGANLSSPANQVERPPITLTKPILIIGLAIVLITLGGFAAVTEGASRLAHIFQQNDPVVLTIIFGLGTILVTDIMLIVQLSRLISAALGQPLDPKKLAQKEDAKQIAPPPANFVPVSSVTDHTTRTLQPSYRQPAERN